MTQNTNFSQTNFLTWQFLWIHIRIHARKKTTMNMNTEILVNFRWEINCRKIPSVKNCVIVFTIWILPISWQNHGWWFGFFVAQPGQPKAIICRKSYRWNRIEDQITDHRPIWPIWLQIRFISKLDREWPQRFSYWEVNVIPQMKKKTSVIVQTR